ncbi:MAG: hypothetical protein WBQ50_10545 [Nocardioides sp.]
MHEPEAGQPRRRTGAIDDLVAVLGSYVVLGVVAGVAWWALYDPAVYTLGQGGGLGMGEVELGKRFNGDAWYAVIAAVAGLLSGTALTWWRDRDPLLTAGLVLLGAVVAAGMMATLGGWIGPADPQSVAASAQVGDAVPESLRVDAFVCYLVWPVTALLGSLIVLWSPPPVSAVPGPGPH